MIITKSSARKVSNHFGMNNSTLISGWKQKFLHGVVDALCKTKGKPSIILEVTKFPKSTYMYWQKRFDSENPDKDIEKEIKSVFEQHNKTYGYRRITATLRESGIIINQKKVRRIMKKLDLKCIAFSHKSHKCNSYKGTIGKIADNKINRRFTTSIPHQKIKTDTTEFKIYSTDKTGRLVIKKAYFDPFLDMFNR